MENEPPSASQVSAIPPWGDKTWKWNLEHKKNFYILENQSFFDMILLEFSFSQSCAHSYEDNDVFDDSFTNAAEFITFTVNQLW